MIMAECGIERRKSKRHPVSEGSLFVCSQGSDNLLAVKDISSHGLQFVYFPDICEAPDCQLIDIMQHFRACFCVAGICCQIVYDIPSLSEHLSFSGIRTRVAGVEFFDLTNEQKDKLCFLIDTLENP
jgi:hypothetical protein